MDVTNPNDVFSVREQVAIKRRTAAMPERLFLRGLICLEKAVMACGLTRNQRRQEALRVQAVAKRRGQRHLNTRQRQRVAALHREAARIEGVIREHTVRHRLMCDARVSMAA